MKRLSFSFLLIAFILWILPLGVCIKPSQEKLACDGQRAMCMCHVMMPKVTDKAMESGIALKAGAPTKENSSGSSGNYFVSAKPAVSSQLQLVSLLEDQYLCYKNPNLTSLDHVPKA